MITTTEFKQQYKISNETFRRARVAAEAKTGHPLTQRQGSKIWVVLEPELILSELSLDAKTRGFEQALEQSQGQVIDGVIEDEVATALAISDRPQAFQLAPIETVKIQRSQTDFSHAIATVGQTKQDAVSVLGVEALNFKDQIKSLFLGAGLMGKQEALLELMQGATESPKSQDERSES